MVKVVNGRPVQIMFAKKRVFKNGKQKEHLDDKEEEEEEEDDYEHRTELKTGKVINYSLIIINYCV